MREKVIYISLMHLSEKISSDWYIDYLIQKGTTVEFWDITSIIRNDFHEVSMKDADYLKKIRSLDEFEKKISLRENRGAVYIILFNFEGRLASIFRCLNKYNCRTALIAWGALPIRDLMVWRKILLKIYSPFETVKNIFFKIKGILYKKLKIIKPFDLAFAAGNVLMESNLFAKKNIPINQPDYEYFKKVKTEDKKFLDFRYIVFIDQYLPFHSDLEHSGIKTLMPNIYYASLNRFFDLIESKFGVKVIISLHPRANSCLSNFNGRDAYIGKTPELVKDAEFVITHYSTAISYAVLNQKPLVFVYTHEMAKLYRHTIMNYLKTLSGYLCASICNIDDLNDFGDYFIRPVNKDVYKVYEQDFIAPLASRNIPTSEIFWKGITENFLDD